MTEKPKHVCFLVAMEGEAKPIIDTFQLSPNKKCFPIGTPMKCFQGNFKGIRISLVSNGKDQKTGCDLIGTQAATLASYLIAQELKPDLLINAGTAGGFHEKGLQIGDVVLAQGKAWFHDRRIPIPPFEEYGKGGYELNDYSPMISELGLKKGVISTGDAFDFTPTDKTQMEENQASLKDMEAAAIAWVCQLMSQDLMIVKGVTDYVRLEESSEEQFNNNFKLTIHNLAQSCRDIVAFLIK